MHASKTVTYLLKIVYTARDPPPSYYDVMGISQLKNDIGAAKEESNNPAIMIFKVCCICIGSCKQSHLGSAVMLSCVFALVICTGIVFILFGALPISLLVVGKFFGVLCNVVQVHKNIILLIKFSVKVHLEICGEYSFHRCSPHW